MIPSDLPAFWRSRADEIERYAPPVAEAFRVAAGELMAALHEAANTELTLDEAAAESGYSKRTLRQFVSGGSIPNAGRKGAPRIRRGDLPRKANVACNGFDAGAEARSILGARR